MDPFKTYQPKPRTMAPPHLTTEGAEAVALQAVAFIVADEELLSGLLAASGCGIDELRQRLVERSFLAGVLDFVLSDEATVLAFAAYGDVSPETPMLARERLAAAL